MIRLMREGISSALSQPVASTLTALIVAGMVFAVMMTTGRTIAAEQQVLSTIDDAGTRLIQVRAEDGAGLTTEILERIGRLEDIEWAGAFSSAQDATNLLIPDGTRVPVRFIATDDLSRVGIETRPEDGAAAFASPEALDALGLVDTSGALALGNGESITVRGEINVPDFLEGLEPLVVIPQETRGEAQTANLVMVVADSPSQVSAIAAAVSSLISVEDPSKVSVQTSEGLAQLRGVVQSQLATSSRLLVLGLLSVTAVLVAVVLYGLVLLRRKDFGRRRALGATRGYIVALVVSQTVVLATVGTLAGLIAGLCVSLVANDPLPGLSFTLAIPTLAIATAAAAALAPAISASQRDPIRELRVP